MESVKKFKMDNTQHQAAKLAQLSDDYQYAETNNIELRASNNNL